LFILIADLPILSASETTEIIDEENIVGIVAKQISEVKDCADGCWHAAMAALVVTSPPLRKALIEIAKRGVRIRTITDITKDNISYCKILVEDGHQLRHLAEIKTIFRIFDRMEYTSVAIVEEKKTPAQCIVSNVKSFVEGQQSLFDALWNNALPAEKRFREIEEDLKPEFTETLRDPTEMQKIGFDLIRSAKEEILLLFSTPNSFLRQKRAGLMRLIGDVALQGKVRTRILTHITKEMEEIVDKLIAVNNVDIRNLQDSSQTRLTTLVVDEKYSLEIEVKDDTKDNSYDAAGSAIYSNSESIVWTHASIFETLWRQSELCPPKVISAE
jgi:hypothetical protein